MEEEVKESWELLEELLDAGSASDLSFFIESLASKERGRAVSRLDEDHHVKLLELLGPELAADFIDDLPDAQAADLLEEVQPATAAAIADEMDSDDRADVMAEMDPLLTQTILLQMDPDEAKEAREMLEYPRDVAGGVMIKEFLSFPEAVTVEEIQKNMRDHADEYADYHVQYVYVKNAQGGIAGILRMRDLLLSRGNATAAELMLKSPICVKHHASLQELEAIFDEHPYIGIPVIDDWHKLVGVILRGDLEEAIGERADERFLKVSGIVGGEELRSMPFIQRSTNRLSWLSPNLILNMASVSVIAMYQDTLEAAIALAVFMPIISDMSGCSGNQAVGVSIRELTLGLINPKEMFHVFKKEVGVGLMNGLILGILLATIAMIYSTLGESTMNPWLGMVVGLALFFNTIIAVSLGGLIPLFLKRLGKDPALASGPILTTVTDMCGFFLVLSLAGQILDKLA